jgi:hypothetical protein
MLDRRRLGASGVRVSEIGISLRGGDAESARLAKEAHGAGVDLFHLDDSDHLPWLARELGPAPVTVLVGAGGPAIGGTFRPDAPDGHLALHSYSALTTQPGALGPYQVFGGWEIGARGAGGSPTRLDLARGVVGSGSSQALGVTYTPTEQSVGLEFLREAHHAGLGIIALGLPGTTESDHRFLVRPRRTLAQAAIQFVLANEYVSCALVRVESADQLREAVSAPAADPLTLGDLERLIELFAHRGDSCM